VKKPAGANRAGYRIAGMTWLLALILKPLAAVFVIFLAFCISRLIGRYMPESKLKRALFSPLPWYDGNRRR
jgi:hypothetical protein